MHTKYSVIAGVYDIKPLTLSNDAVVHCISLTDLAIHGLNDIISGLVRIYITMYLCLYACDNEK